MKLQRHTSDDPHGGTFDGHPTEYYRADAVDALLFEIRAAVAHVVSVAPDWWVDYDYEQGDECRSCGGCRDKAGNRCDSRDLAHRDVCERAALDALLVSDWGRR